MAPIHSGGNNKIRTLIVEDNATFRQLLRDSLQTLFPSMVIEETPDGTVALQKVATFSPHLIFMDVQMPGENGFQITRKVKATHPGIMVVILTSHNTQEYREAAVQCGASSFVPKDALDPETIEILVRSLPPP